MTREMASLYGSRRFRKRIIDHQQTFKFSLPISKSYISSIKSVITENLPKFAYFDKNSFEFEFNPSAEQAGHRFLIKFTINTDTDQQILELPIQVQTS